MKPYSFETLQVHAGQTPDGETFSRAVPIYQTTSYVYDSARRAADVFSGAAEGFTYTRIENPTVSVLEKRICALEKGKAAVAFASGMAAITAAVFALCESGDHIVAISTLYGGTATLLGSRLPKWAGIRTTFVPPDDLDAMEVAIQPQTKCVYLETI
ncbi:MAG: O-acetylhomoserine aminocarboxypropyltransferase/cysteine synthase, partial [Clostridia bacterium]|nr:O-acetylhomoserine aminocarboxypropyltransferase/cysteine synthase [Clostridia bacterium]